MNYTELLKDPKFRILRRVIVTMLSVIIAGILYIVGTDPKTMVDNLLLIKAEDIVQLLKFATGVALLMGIDKLKRELPNFQ